ncbi:hypothetical protein [Nocardia brevicatena]|uniref:hypothetical protein n=1 Tax=Nocardia brevicatena TaxID=37327 RepID=UPI000593587E|nr:hypothetical protein [Nocardia brevicatena]
MGIGAPSGGGTWRPVPVICAPNAQHAVHVDGAVDSGGKEIAFISGSHLRKAYSLDASAGFIVEAGQDARVIRRRDPGIARGARCRGKVVAPGGGGIAQRGPDLVPAVLVAARVRARHTGYVPRDAVQFVVKVSTGPSRE